MIIVTIATNKNNEHTIIATRATIVIILAIRITGSIVIIHLIVTRVRCI